MSARIYPFLLGLCLAVAAHPAPSPDAQMDQEVEELDRLKKEKGPGNLEVVTAEKTRVTEADGGRKEKTEREKLVLSDGRLLAGSHRLLSTQTSSTERPPRTASRSRTEKWEEQGLPSQEHYRKYAGVKYTPADLADYIVRTGDEESVALAIEELLREGIFTREEAISYLQEVKNVRDYVQSDFYRRPRRDGEADSVVTATLRQATTKAPVGIDRAVTESNSLLPTTDGGGVDYGSFSGREVELDDLLEKMRTASSAREEYTLEEIIFQLSKDMFAQSLLRGDPTAEESLTKMAAFLESEVSNHRISRETEQRILDIVSAALIETLKEFPGLLPDNPVYRPERASSYRPPLSFDRGTQDVAAADPSGPPGSSGRARGNREGPARSTTPSSTGKDAGQKRIREGRPQAAGR